MDETNSPASPGASSYPSADLIQHTIRVWEPRLRRKLTDEDARQILSNAVGFFGTLAAWERRAQKSQISAEDLEQKN